MATGVYRCCCWGVFWKLLLLSLLLELFLGVLFGLSPWVILDFPVLSEAATRHSVPYYLVSLLWTLRGLFWASPGLSQAYCSMGVEKEALFWSLKLS